MLMKLQEIFRLVFCFYGFGSRDAQDGYRMLSPYQHITARAIRIHTKELYVVTRKETLIDPILQ